MKRILLSLTLVMMVVCCFAAVTQTGYVKTRGRLDSNGQVISGKRLASATVVLQNGSSVVSNQSGDFSLSLPENKYYLKNVKKEGYIIVDPDILSKQYAYSANPLVLVLDEPTAQQDDRLASERELRRNLQEQLHQREDELEAMKKENKITRDQYSEALQKLYSDHGNNEKFIAEMAERYSKIDFDQLDDFQRQMAEYIQNGELVRADSLLRTKGSMDDREAEIKRILDANAKEEQELIEREKVLSKSKKTAKALLADFGMDCYNHFALCKLKFDNDSAAYWLERRVQLDTTNIDWLHDAGRFIANYIADYGKAYDYYNRALKLSIDEYGENNLKVSSIYTDIGHLYYDEYKLYEAKDYYEKALNIQKELLGENHRNMTDCLIDIGLIYSEYGEYDEAQEFFEKSLKILSEISDEYNPDVAKCYRCIGMVYYEQGKYDEALDYFERSLKICEEQLGENHPDVSTNYDNIGMVYYEQGKYDEALDYFERSLKIRTDRFGENHPGVATNYDNMGMVYYEQGKYDEALDYFERSLKIKLMTLLKSEYVHYGHTQGLEALHEKIVWEYNNPEEYDPIIYPDLGLNPVYLRYTLLNPLTRSIYNTMASIFDIQGKYIAALSCYNKCMYLQQSLFQDYPHSALCHNRIGFVYYQMGEYENALSSYEYAMEKLRNRFGDHHPMLKKIQLKINEVKDKLAPTL